MSLAIVNLTEGAAGYDTGANTASISWAAGNIIHVAIGGGTAGLTPTLTRAGLTFNLLGARRDNANGWGASLTEWVSDPAAAPGSGTIAIGWVSNNNYLWSVNKITGMAASPYGTPVGITQGLTLTIGALAAATSIALGSYVVTAAGVNTAGSGFSLLGTARYDAGKSLGLLVEYQLNVTTVNVGGGQNTHQVGQGTEIKELAASGNVFQNVVDLGGDMGNGLKGNMQ